MKYIFIFVLLYANVIFAQNYEAKAKIEQIYWQNDDEWRANLRADLYLDAVLLQPGIDYDPSEMSYLWQELINGIWIDRGTNILQTTDGHNNQGWQWRVRITGPGFSDLSDAITVVKYGDIKKISCYAYKSDGSLVIGDVDINIWAKYSWYQHSPSNNYFVSDNEVNYFKDSVKNPQQFNQSFYNWDTNIGEEYYRNHEGIEVGSNLTTINAHHKYFNNLNFNFNLVSEFPDMKISLQDPWLVKNISNYFEAPYGYRNLGLSAIPEEGINGTHKVLLNQNSTFDPNIPFYSISIPSSINLPQNGGVHNIYLQNWSVTGATLQYPNSLSTGVVFTSSSGANITANVKATQLSNNANAFANNSQRKLIKTPDGVMHLVYESMGRVWYETSTDNGQTWQLMNGGRPLDNGAGKCPAIDYSYNAVAIVYQEQSGSNYTIQLKAFLPVNGQYVYNYGTTLYLESGAPYSTSNASPVIGWASSSKLVLVWKGVSSLKYVFGDLAVNSYSSTFTYYGSGDINGSTAYSYSPSISVDKFDVGSIIKYALVWQQGPSNGQSAIYYSPISVVYQSGTPPPIEAATVATGSAIVQPDAIGYWYFVQSSTSNISSGTTAYNYKPSVILLHDGYTRFCWQNQYYSGSNSRVVFKASNNSRFWYFGSNIRTPQITATDDNTNYYIIWNEKSDNSTKFTDNTTLSTIYNLSTTGQAVQLSNGANRDNMYALVFNNQSQPYFFKTTPSIGSKYGLQKSTLASNQIVGRGGVVLKDSVGFFFTLENISVNNQPVDFVDVSDTLVIDDIKQLNNYLISQPFTLSDNSGLNFNIVYGTTTTENKIFENKNTVSYSVDLIEANSSKLLGNVKKVIFDKNNLPAFETQAFQINAGKLTGSKTVQLKLTAQNNFNGQCLLTKSYSDILPNELAKLNIKEMGFDDILSVTEYALDQNYPNPFNPSTKISWQSPVGSHQTLKVYDILGNEVATLVNEFREAGKYEVNFDASTLASGVYIYKLTAGNFTASKKLMLLK